MNYTAQFNAKAKQTHLELSLKGDAPDAGLQELNNAPAPDIDHPKANKKKKKNDVYTRLLQLITSTQIKLQDFIDQMDRDLIAAKEELQRYLDMIEERKALTDNIDLLEKGGVLEHYQDGTLKDRNLQRAIERYANDHNLKTDFSDDAYVLSLGRNAITLYPTSLQLEQLAQVQHRVVDTIRTGRDEAITIQYDLDNADNLTDDEIQEKCEKADILINSRNEKIDFLKDTKTKILSNSEPIEETSMQHNAFVISPGF